jgi:hypothetical protein
MLFGQASAPTGWTKKTDWTDDSMIVYTTGTPAAGGSDNPKSWTTAISNVAESEHVHTVSAHVHAMSNHAHKIYDFASNSVDGKYFDASGNAQDLNATNWGGNIHLGLSTASGEKVVGVDMHTNDNLVSPVNTGSGGNGNTGSTSHTHSVSQDTFAPKYQEVIAATRN